MRKEKLKKSKKLKNTDFWVVDTEDNSKGKMYQAIFYTGKKFYRFTTQKQVLNFVEGLNKKVVIWAVNLEYDIINLFRGNYKLLTWIFGKSRLISITYKNAVFYDTLNHWKMSVKQMGQYLKIKKLKLNPKSIKYCKMDCKVTYDFIDKMMKHYTKIGFTVKSTLPSTVYNYWKDNYYVGRIVKISDLVLNVWRKGYYGGRCDCFYIGEYKATGKEKIRVIDVNSLYPYVMQKGYPIPYNYSRGKLNINSYGLTYCKVKVNQEIPVLPYRKNGKLMYCNGVFEGCWTNHELKYAKSYQGFKILKVSDSYTFDYECFPFVKFVQKLWGLREKVRNNDELLSMVYKLSMNSLYGKFAQGNERSYIMALKNFIKRKRPVGTNRVNIYDDIVIYSALGLYPINTNMIWSIYTTSYARIYMHKQYRLIKHHGGKLLYTDTDSITYASVNPLADINKYLGGFKDEGTYNKIDIRLPKMYQLYNDKKVITKVKGVPHKNQKEFFKKGKVKYKKPLKFKESLRRKQTANFWVDYSKTNKIIYNKGVILKNGDVRPFTLK